jgi:hypothetical protein
MVKRPTPDRRLNEGALSRDPAASYAAIEAESGARALELWRVRLPDCLFLKGAIPDLYVLAAPKKLAAPLLCAMVAAWLFTRGSKRSSPPSP